MRSISSDSASVGRLCGTYVARQAPLTLRHKGLCGVPLRQAPCLPLHLPMPCQRLAVKDAVGAAQRSKILDGEGHGHTLSRAAQHPHRPSSLTPGGRTSLPASIPFSQPQLTIAPLRAAGCHPGSDSTAGLPRAGSGRQLVPGVTHGNHDASHQRFPQHEGARSWRAPRRPGAKRSRPPIILLYFNFS
jgi:hypothetical protein